MTSEAFPADTHSADLAPTDPANAARNGLVINLLLVSAFVVILNETILTLLLLTGLR